MKIQDAIARLEELKALGETDIVFAHWTLETVQESIENISDIIIDANEWSAIAERIEDKVDYSSVNDQFIDIIEKFQ